jgi:hypothetical protein
MWASSLLADTDRCRALPPHYRRLVTRSNGDVLATLLAHGYVARGVGARSRAAAKPPRSTGCPRRHGPGSQTRPGRWRRCWPTATPSSTAATPASGPRYPAPKSGHHPASLGRGIPVRTSKTPAPSRRALADAVSDTFVRRDLGADRPRRPEQITQLGMRRECEVRR